ncbi:MAG: nitroreductase/quinone reductase family protein [Dermatophilaceae bacterium]
MNWLMKQVARGGNALTTSLYRWSGGRIGGSMRGMSVLLLTVPGRQSGQPRSACVGYFPFEDGYLVVGSGGGSAKEPGWFRNLRKAGRATARIGRDVQEMTVEVLADPRRGEVFKDVVLSQAPVFARYETKSGRQMPIALLRPAR